MHRVHIFRDGKIVTHEFKEPKEAVRFYYLSHVNSDKSHIELIASDVEFFDFFPPKVISFSGAFVNELFVGSCKIEREGGEIESIEGVFLIDELDFSKFSVQKLSESAKQAITGLMLSGAREIGRNDNTGQTFLLYGDQMISVDDTGCMLVSPKMSTWNESIDQLLYDYQIYNQDEEVEHE
jgi:hypothetical protein